ncbi:transcription factor bHLH52-like [Papaver somniferum]|uniref:transcription factor bHLH52-like n=1 Tax=Papaver somniferum TaxID=3469 RepID=UPI000E70091A|nr:transcription factor bHLH52-like [Papaver somniferum]
MMINAIKNPIGCFNNFELQREAELLKNQPPSNVYYPNTRNNNNDPFITTTKFPSPLTNTSFISNTSNRINSTNDISHLFQQEDYSPYTNDYGPILSTFSSLPVDNEVMIPFNNDYEFNTPASIYPSLKRQRPCVLPCFPPDNFAFNDNDGNPMSSCCCPNSLVDQFLLPSPTNTTANEVPAAQPAYANYGGGDYVETSNGKKSNSGYLSAQSVAARERRRKISEKTQQLGKLVPGGSKLNTAEMFHAAYKYIKFLQAQIGALEFMGSVQEKKMDCLTPHLGVLLASLPIQEKLYADGKCLVSSRCAEIMRRN